MNFEKNTTAAARIHFNLFVQKTVEAAPGLTRNISGALPY